MSDFEPSPAFEDMGPTQRLAELGVTVPDAPAPAAAYVSYVARGDLLYVSGQLPLVDGELLAAGRLGDTVELIIAQQCARQCAINVLAQVRAAGHQMEDVSRIIKLTVFVASAPEFHDPHLVANGASEFLGEVFGDPGRHVRSAVGVAVLPRNSPVEVEALIEVRRPS